MNVKQVIVIRRDLKMRRGKEIAQGSHVSMAWLRERVLAGSHKPQIRGPQDPVCVVDMVLDEVELAWLSGDFRKVVCQVESEEELMGLWHTAVDAGLKAHLITDLGLTEFAGPTVTALAIGPDLDEKIDPITRHLRLY